VDEDDIERGILSAVRVRFCIKDRLSAQIDFGYPNDRNIKIRDRFLTCYCNDRGVVNSYVRSEWDCSNQGTDDRGLAKTGVCYGGIPRRLGVAMLVDIARLSPDHGPHDGGWSRIYRP
jgi:hypothetical protein